MCLCAKYNHIYIRYKDTTDKFWIKRVSYIKISFIPSVHKPIHIIGDNICSSTCVNNHRFIKLRNKKIVNIKKKSHPKMTYISKWRSRWDSNPRSPPWQGGMLTTTPLDHNFPKIRWRRRRDLNSRASFPTYTLSRGTSSATWVLLQEYFQNTYFLEQPALSVTPIYNNMNKNLLQAIFFKKDKNFF